jgi:hypothetical protein
MADLLERIRGELQQRLVASRAAVEQSARLEAALQALSGAHAHEAAAAQRARTTSGREPLARPAPTVQAARRRAPRGANRAPCSRPSRTGLARRRARLPRARASRGASSTPSFASCVAEGLLVKRELPSGRSGYSQAANEDPPADPDADRRNRGDHAWEPVHQPAIGVIGGHAAGGRSTIGPRRRDRGRDGRDAPAQSGSAAQLTRAASSEALR